MMRSTVLFLVAVSGTRPRPDAYTVPLENILVPASPGPGRCGDNLAGLLRCFQMQNAAAKGAPEGQHPAQEPLRGMVDILRGAAPHGERADDAVNSVFRRIIEGQTGLLSDEVRAAMSREGAAMPREGTASQGQHAAQPSASYQQPAPVRQPPQTGAYQSRAVVGYMPSYSYGVPQQGARVFVPAVVRPLNAPSPAQCMPSTQVQGDDGCTGTEEDSSTGSEDSEDTKGKRKSCRQKMVAIRCVCKETNGGLKDCECNKDT